MPENNDNLFKAAPQPPRFSCEKLNDPDIQKNLDMLFQAHRMGGDAAIEEIFDKLFGQQDDEDDDVDAEDEK